MTTPRTEPPHTTPAAEIEQRIGKLQAEILHRRIDAALILQRADLFYFTGTVQQAHLYVPAEGDPLLMVNKSLERARQETPLTGLVGLDRLKKLPDVLRRKGYEPPGTLGMELDVIPAKMYLGYGELFGEARIVDVSHPIRLTRAVKSAYELELIRQAARRADAVASRVPDLLRPGMTELELAGKIEAEARGLGHQGVLRMRLWGNELHFGHVMSGSAASEPSFLSSPTGGSGVSPAVAQGPSFKRIRRHEPVLVDHVFAYCGYLADHTRIYVLGSLPDELLAAHEAMLEVQERIKTEARPGVRAGDLYEVALEHAAELGYESHFMGFGLDRVRFVGHGIGTEVDEYPFLARGQELELVEGMVIALEPKLVFPGKGVVGIENTHVVTAGGLEQLTQFREEVIAV